MLASEDGLILVDWARASLRRELGGPDAPRPGAPWCEELAATFVTLRWGADKRLQGCIGALEPQRTLVDDVAHNAIAAALFDPRATPLMLGDVDELDLEISILSPLEPIPFVDEASAIAALRPGTDGVVFAAGGRRATLLPTMWSSLPAPEVFLSALKAKAGYPRGAWGEDVRLWRYTTEKHVGAACARTVFG